jgi:hypothetical protein
LLKCVKTISSSKRKICVNKYDERVRRILFESIVDKFAKTQAELLWCRRDSRASEYSRTVLTLGFH